MSETPDDVPRAPTRLDPETFKRILQLTRQQPWLEEESDALLALWNLCDDGAQQDLMCDLLNRFTSVDSKRTKDCGETVATHIVETWKLGAESTFLAATEQADSADGSQAFLQMLKDKFVGKGSWSAANFINSIGAAAKKARPNSVVVLVDDFAGTGDTFQRKIRWYRRQLEARSVKNVTLKACLLAGMQKAKGVIEAEGVEVFSCMWLPRGISDHYEGEALHQARSCMLNLENKLHPTRGKQKLVEYSFGYKQSEALYSLHGFNVPNNVFPIFWWPELLGPKVRKTILRRL